MFRCYRKNAECYLCSHWILILEGAYIAIPHRIHYCLRTLMHLRAWVSASTFTTPHVVPVTIGINSFATTACVRTSFPPHSVMLPGIFVAEIQIKSDVLEIHV